MIELTAHATEGSDFEIELTLTNRRTGDGVTLASGEWVLRDHLGEVVGAARRELTALASPLLIVVPGAELALPTRARVRRRWRVTVTGTYNPTWGDPGTGAYAEEVSFYVHPVAGD